MSLFYPHVFSKQTTALSTELLSSFRKAELAKKQLNRAGASWRQYYGITGKMVCNRISNDAFSFALALQILAVLEVDKIDVQPVDWMRLRVFLHASKLASNYYGLRNQRRLLIFLRYLSPKD